MTNRQFPESLRIRSAVLPQDRDDLLTILRQVDSLHVEKVPYMFQMLREYEYGESTFVERMPLGADRFLLCAELDGRVVGFIYCLLRESAPYPLLVPHRFLMIDNLAVLEGYRGQGIGSALMAAAEAKARELGADDIRLNVWEANEDALRFYEFLGFETAYRHMVLRLA